MTQQEPRLDEASFARELGIDPELWTRLGWQRITADRFDLIHRLTELGFTKDAKLDARGGAYLLAIWWRKGERVQICNHRLRYDQHKKRPGKYDFPKGRGLAMHGAFGRLLDDPAAWRSLEVPCLFVEGEKKAAVVASYVGDRYAVVSCPGVWNQSEARSDEEKSSGYPRRPHDDFKALELRKRRVVFIGDRDAIDGTKPLVRRGSDETCKALAQRGAEVLEVYPPAGPWKGIDDWINARRDELHPDEAHGVLREELLALLGNALGWAPPDGEVLQPAPAHEQGARLSDVLPAHLHAGPADLVMPERFAILDAKGAPLSTVGADGKAQKIATSAFWPVAEIQTSAGNLLEVAAIVRGRLLRLRVPRGLLHDRRRLCVLLATAGVNLRPDAEERVPDYLSAFLEANEATLPVHAAQPSTGWDELGSSFLYGGECLGGTTVLAAVDEDQAASAFVEALGRKGSGAVWKEAAEEMLRGSPVAGLVLAASVASPMLRPFGWSQIGILLGALGGAGKSSLLRLAASVYGSSGPPELDQPSGLVGKADGTTRGLLLQFRRLAHLPHIADELKPSLVDPRKREELASTLHDIFEGREHIRATRTSEGTKVGWAFPGCAILAGEVSASDFLRKGGVIRRYLAPPAPYVTGGSHLGRFREVLAAHHGHLGRALIEALVGLGEHRRWQLRQRHREHHDALAVGERAPEHERSWARQIATALGAVDVCAELCPELCPEPALWKQAIEQAWEGIQGATGGDESDVAARAWERTRSWLAQNRARLVASKTHRERLRSRSELDPEERAQLQPRGPVLGQIVEARAEGEPDERLLVVDLIQSALTEFLSGEGYSSRTLTGAWIERKWLETTDGQRAYGDASRFVRVNGTRARVYRLRVDDENGDLRSTRDTIKPLLFGFRFSTHRFGAGKTLTNLDP